MNKNIKRLLNSLTGSYLDDTKRVSKYLGNKGIKHRNLQNLLFEIVSNKYNEKQVKRFILLFDYSYFEDFAEFIIEFVDKDGNNLPMLAVKTGYSVSLIKYMYSHICFNVNHVNNHNETIIHMILKSDILKEDKDINNLYLLYDILVENKFNFYIIDDNNEGIIDILEDKIENASTIKDRLFCNSLIDLRETFYLDHIDLLMKQLNDNDKENYNLIKQITSKFFDTLILKSFGQCEENLMLVSIKRILRQINLHRDAFKYSFSINNFGREIIDASLTADYNEDFILAVLEELFNYGFRVDNCNSIINDALLKEQYSGSVYNIYQWFLNKGFNPLTENFKFQTYTQAYMPQNKYYDESTTKLLGEIKKYEFIKYFKQLCNDHNISFIINDINYLDNIWLIVMELQALISNQYSLPSFSKLNFANLIVSQAIENRENNINMHELVINEETILSLMTDLLTKFYNQCLDKIKTYKLSNGK